MEKLVVGGKLAGCGSALNTVSVPVTPHCQNKDTALQHLNYCMQVPFSSQTPHPFLLGSNRLPGPYSRYSHFWSKQRCRIQTWHTEQWPNCRISNYDVKCFRIKWWRFNPAMFLCSNTFEKYKKINEIPLRMNVSTKWMSEGKEKLLPNLGEDVINPSGFKKRILAGNNSSINSETENYS